MLTFVVAVLASMALFALWRLFTREDAHAPIIGSPASSRQRWRDRADGVLRFVRLHLRVAHGYLAVRRAIRRRDIPAIKRANEELARAIRELRPESAQRADGGGTFAGVSDAPPADPDPAEPR